MIANQKPGAALPIFAITEIRLSQNFPRFSAAIIPNPIPMTAPIRRAAIVKLRVILNAWETLTKTSSDDLSDCPRSPWTAFPIQVRYLSEDFVKGIRQMILPTLVLMLPTIAAITRQTRSAMLETLNQEFVRTARSKGQNERVVILKHVLKNALTPILTMFGLRLNNCFAGAMISESIFGIPGMGSIMLAAILDQDTNVMLGGTLFMSISVVLITLFIDIMYGVVDPRMRSTK